ncbi:tyrosine kinase, putative, partial [Entamoeba invadens IP1]
MILLLLLISTTVYSQIQSCKQYVTPNHCFECYAGAHLEIRNTDNSPVPDMLCVTDTKITNCATQDSNACIACNEGFYLKDNQCSDCKTAITSCNKCNSTHCFGCDDSLTLSNDQTKCVDCSLSANSVQCGKCDAGTYFNVEQRKCLKCTDKCAVCTSAVNCYKCESGNLLVKDGTVSCTPIMNCKHLVDDHCESCESGFYLFNGGCKACGNNCSLCYSTTTDTTICSTCKDGYTLQDGKCYEYSDINCQTGSPSFGCITCSDGYYFGSTAKCEKCDGSCAKCVENATNCISCNTNYYFNENVCVLKDENCKLVDQSGCKECANTQNMRGFYIPENGKRCEQCAENCQLCEKLSTNCTACVDNYLLRWVSTSDSEDTGYYTCLLKDDTTCGSAQMGYCTNCTDGRFISESGKNQECTLCDKSCDTCEDSLHCYTCADGYFLPKNYSTSEKKPLCWEQSTIDMTCTATKTGCDVCKKGYWIDSSDNTQFNCTECPQGCESCQYSPTSEKVMCSSCISSQEYVKDGVCNKCSELKNCKSCKEDKCDVCQDGYTIDAGGVSCSKTNWALIIPLVVIGILLIVAVIFVIIVIIWWKRKKSLAAESTAIKPFHVSSDLQMLLLGADNEKFPLKTDKWELNFDGSKAKVVVDMEYEETINLANMTKKEYYFEFHYTPSHKYDLDITPNNATLRPGNAMAITFKMKVLCTTSICDQIGITAMDVDEQNKETAALKIIVESDLSLKLDHTELKPVMPPIGEGAFGMVFRGTYRGRDVAIKKMKARNLTPEQEKEFSLEVSMMTQLRSNTVVELIGAVYTEGEISIVTEFAEYGSLSKIWKKQTLNYQLKVKILDDMAVALSYLHQNMVLHRDVKGENLLVFSLNPHSPVCAKLTDFGTCRNISERNLAAKTCRRVS